MSNEYGWEFWQDAEIDRQTPDGARLFYKEGYWCLCDPGVEPGDAEARVTGSQETAGYWWCEEEI